METMLNTTSPEVSVISLEILLGGTISYDFPSLDTSPSLASPALISPLDMDLEMKQSSIIQFQEAE